MELDVEFQTSNINVNKGLDNMIKDINIEKKLNKKLNDQLKDIVETDNAFDQSYSDSVNEYNYTILYGTSIIGMICLMIYSGKIKYNQ